jgi:beta-lactamase regulating signal transducer with metallopeptidase domain
VTAWAIEALLASGVLLVVVLALRLPVRRAFGPQVAYALWALPLLRLLLPPLPQGWTRVAPVPLADASEQLALLVLPPALPEAEPSLIGPALVLLWSTGAALFLLWQLGSYLRFVRRVAATGTTLGRVGRIALVVSDHVAGPLAFGLARPVVAVPRDFSARYDAAERELALLHEVGHHRRGDVWANWAALAVLALHWCNPLAWIAFRAFRFDQEMANDAGVLAGRDPTERYSYACALVRTGGGRVPAGACELHTIDDLKGRLRMLATTTSRSRRITGTVAIAGVTLAALGLTASGSEAADAVRTHVEDATGVSLDALAPAAILPALPRHVAPPPPLAHPAHDAPHAKRVVIVRDGETETFEGPAADAYIAEHPLPARPAPPMPPIPDAAAVPPAPSLPPLAGLDSVTRGPWHAAKTVRTMPRIAPGSCGGGAAGGAMTMTRIDGGRQQIVICADRIFAAAGHAHFVGRNAELAMIDSGRIRRQAMAHALQGLRRARERLAGGDAPRHAEAMNAINRSIARMEREVAERN